MPPETESTELQVINLEKFSVAQLPELQGKKEEINALIALNPIVEIIDTATYEAAKKSRTAVKTLRTGLEKEQADVKRKIKTHILDVVDKEYDLLVSNVKIEETLRQDGVAEYESKKEIERQEKARIEKERVDNINKEINDYVAEWKTVFCLMNFDSIQKVSADFLESYTTYDTAILEEFEALFPTKIEELTKYLSEKTTSLTEAENARLEKLRIEEEAKLLAQQKAEFEAKQKLADEAEAKAKKEREDFEKEKTEFAKNKQISERKNTLSNLGIDENIVLTRLGVSGHGMLMNTLLNGSDNDFQIECDNAIKRIAELDAKKAKETEVLEAVIIPETIQPEKVEAVEILETELSTVNVCNRLTDNEITEHSKEMHAIADNAVISGLFTPTTTPTTTWESIENEFKSAGEKSYSKWLKDNYNPPTKKQ